MHIFQMDKKLMLKLREDLEHLTWATTTAFYDLFFIVSGPRDGDVKIFSLIIKICPRFLDQLTHP